MDKNVRRTWFKFNIFFLDEKWFYITSRRKKLKILPRAEFESLQEADFVPKKVRSRRHLCKIMYLGVVGPHIDGKSDGKIFLKRVSEKTKTKRQSYNQHFNTYFEINNRLKMEEWKLMYDTETRSVSSLMAQIIHKYKINNWRSDNLCFQYKSYKI